MTLTDSDWTCLGRLRELGSAAVSDALGELGCSDYVAGQGIRPAHKAHACAGPVRIARFDPTDDDPRDFGPLARFIDAVAPGQVLLLAGSPAAPGAMWGDLCSAAAEGYEAGGVVIDGFLRDEGTLEEAALPLFSRGSYPRDCLASSNIGAVDVPTEVAGVEVRPGNIVVADRDGVVFFEANLIERILVICEKALVAEESLRKLLKDPSGGGSLFDAVSRLGAL